MNTRRFPMGEREDYARGYLKGFEDALNEVWTEVLSFGTRAYSPHELQILARTRKNMIQQTVDVKRQELQKMFGVILTKPNREVPSEFTIRAGSSIVVREERPDRAFSIFASMLSGGSAGMSVTRTDPSRVIEKYHLDAGKTTFIWLTKIEKDEIVQGDRRYLIRNNLPNLAAEIRSFYSRVKGGIVILEGLEYLVTQYEFRPVLRFIQMVNEQTEYSSGYFIVTVDPQTIEDRDYRLLEKEMSLTV
ncbi:MAG: DUF835 domain-containing protein [Thermoplasmata archaeon]|nr:DUF835 domain-containing protein [Candidatus Sysuiplasma acidicola]